MQLLLAVTVLTINRDRALSLSDAIAPKNPSNQQLPSDDLNLMSKPPLCKRTQTFNTLLPLLTSPGLPIPLL
jgi:hypothetical protein